MKNIILEKATLNIIKGKKIQKFEIFKKTNKT